MLTVFPEARDADPTARPVGAASLRAAGPHADRRRAGRATGSLLVAYLLCWSVAAAAADDAPTPLTAAAAPSDDTGPEQWAIHGQSTFVWGFQPAYHSPYLGEHSLAPPVSNGRETFDITLYGGFRPWQGAEIWVNPELDQGFGLGNSLGVAGYLSGEAYKLGATDPYGRLARAFFRQTIDLGGETEKIDPDLNQLGGTQTANRLVFTIGKFSVTDIFDTNKYAHDPRADFLNWAVLDLGSFDYAADAWGATYGAAAEWYQGRWTARVGIFDLTNVPNSSYLDVPLLQQNQYVAELEERHTLWDQPGKLKVLYWITFGNLGTYNDALAQGAATGQTPSTIAVAKWQSKYGVGFNLEQQLTPDLGMFARAGWSQGSVEEVDFTDINQSAVLGLSLAGTRWGRPDDTVGLAGVINQISHQAKDYFAAGGIGGIIGDGQLPKAGPEQILETYYNYAAFSFLNVSLDYQFVNNPAYNRQRGPVSAFFLRVHAQF